ncbi:MAG TPA: hypothetical protein VIY27_11220 [Myxococcota bacterium]
MIFDRAIELAQEGRIDWSLSKDPPSLKGGAAFEGRVIADGDRTWRFVVISFGIEDQGFEPGSLGYDGTVVVASAAATTVVRMTRSVAETMHAAATASTASDDG